MIVTTSSGTTEFDLVISTIPITVLKKIASTVQGVSELRPLKYQGVVNLLVFLNRPLDNYYWTPVLQSSTEFDGVVESSALVKTDQYLGNHAAYLMKYTAQDSELFLSDDETIKNSWLDQFLEIYGSRGITRSNVEACFLFKAPFVEPLYPLGYDKMKPEIQPGRSGLFLATTAQVYPNITSWNSSIRLAEECVETVLRKTHFPGKQQAGAAQATVPFGRRSHASDRART
jgi:protoporphyrinogen oxidase